MLAKIVLIFFLKVEEVVVIGQEEVIVLKL